MRYFINHDAGVLVGREASEAESIRRAEQATMRTIIATWQLGDPTDRLKEAFLKIDSPVYGNASSKIGDVVVRNANLTLTLAEWCRELIQTLIYDIDDHTLR